MKIKYFKHDNIKKAEGIRAFSVSITLKTEMTDRKLRPSLDLTLWDRTWSLEFYK
jgi:hypothetical protein